MRRVTVSEEENMKHETPRLCNSGCKRKEEETLEFWLLVHKNKRMVLLGQTSDIDLVQYPVSDSRQVVASEGN